MLGFLGNDLRRVQYQYWVTRQDVAQETEKWAEWAELASAAIMPILLFPV